MVKVIEIQQVERDIVVDVTCDRCGGSCFKGDPDMRQIELATFDADWGYFSDHDLEQWHADLCQSCAEDVKAFINAGTGAGVQIKDLIALG